MLTGKANKNRILLLLLLLISVMFSLQGCKAVGQSTIALEQSVRCGMEEHIHGEDCYLGDVLLCGKKAHTHGENCYLVRLDDNDINHLLGRVDETTDHSLETLIGNVLRGALGLDPLSPTPTPTPLPGWEAIDDGNALTNDDIMMINRAITDGVVKADIVLNERLLTVHSSGNGISEAEALAMLAQSGTESATNSADAAGDTGGVSMLAVGSEESDEDNTANFYINLDGNWTHVGTLGFNVTGSRRNYSRSIDNTNILSFVNEIVDPDVNSIDSLNMEFGTNPNNISSTASVGNTTTSFGTGIRNSSTASSTIYVSIVDLNFYTVEWANYDGTVLETDIAAAGATPVYNGAAPIRVEDTQYTYAFSGWTPKVSAVTGKVTYTATYTAIPKAYIATFENLSGTEIADDISGKPTNGKLNITLPALSGEYAGYLWIVKDSDGETNYNSDGTASVDITGNTTFVAIPGKYEVNFDSAGGTAVTSQTVEYLKYATKPTAPTRTGYTFKGWQLSGADYDFSTAVTEDITLTAKWEINEYTVTFDSNGGSAVSAQTVEHGDTATKPTAPTRTGYTFKGWQLNGADYDFSTAVTGDITLTAKWEINTYTVTYTDADGNTLYTSDVVEHGGTITLPDPPTGMNWYIDGTKYNPGVYTITTDMNFVAVSTVTLTYVDENGDASSTEYTYGATATVKEAPDGYMWVGEDGAEYAGGDKIVMTSNIKLTASPYLTISYTVNFPPSLSGKTLYPEGGLGSDPSDFNVSAVGVPTLTANSGATYTIEKVTQADAPHTAEALNYREVFYWLGDITAYEYQSVYFLGWEVTADGNTELIEPGESISWDKLLELAEDGTVELEGKWEYDGAHNVTFYVNYSATAADNEGNYVGGKAEDYTPEVFCGHLFGLPASLTYDEHNSIYDNYSEVYGITGNALKSNIADAQIRSLYGAGVSYDGVTDVFGDAITGGSEDDAATLYMTDFPTDEEVLAKIKEWYGDGKLSKDLMYDDGNGSPAKIPYDTDEYGNRVYSTLDTDHYTVRWYVFKSQSDGWHVDGRLIRKVGNIKVVKTFEGNPELVEEAISTAAAYGTGKPFITASCAAQDNRVVDLYFVPQSEHDNGYYYDDATGEYYWVIDEVLADDVWTITEAPPSLPYSLSISEYMWNNIITDTSGSGTDVELTMDGGTYPADAYDINWIRADFTNIYHKEDTILVRKVDGKTMVGLSGAVFNLYSDEIVNADDEPQIMYFKPVTKTVYAGTDNEFTYTIYEYDSAYDASTGVCDLPVGENGYLEYVVSGFSYETHNIIVTEKTSPAGYAAVGDVVVGYTGADNTVGIKSGGGDAAEYSNGILTVKNYSGGTATVTANKIWDCDKTYYDGFAVRFELYANGMVASAAIPGFTTDFGSYYVYLDENGAYVETNADGSPKYLSNTPWSFTWSGLPTVLSGNAVTYTIVETQIGSEVADRTGNFPNWISDELYNNISTDSTGNQEISIAIRNTPDRAMIRLTKYDPMGNTLPGAEFTLTELNASGVPVSSALTDETDEYGVISFDNLKYETWYKLTETAPPPGHISLCDTVYIKLAETGVVTVTTDMNDASATSEYMYYPGQANNVHVINLPVTPLPETGGGGTWPYTLGGTLLLAAALLMIYRKSRRKEDAPYV